MRSIAIATISLALVMAGCGGGGNTIHSALAEQQIGSFTNPVRIALPNGRLAESCPDPSIIHGQQPGDSFWYLYCTSEIFSDHGSLHYMAISKSPDLVNWTYVGDVFPRKPSFVAGDGYLWAPDIQFFNGRYYLYYAVSNTRAGGAAIFVATSDKPAGPWTAHSTPVVEPEPVPGRGMRATIDPAVMIDGDQRYIFYGSFNGGVSVRTLSADGLSSRPESQVQVTLSDRYEAPYVIKRNGYFYLMISAGTCCDGSLSGYGVFVARSNNVAGPYIDKDGNSLLDPRIGGTPILETNGNRWIGPGHNAVATDLAGTDWMVYHAIDSAKPYFAGSWTRRPAMLDRIDWIDGWPVMRGGQGPSDSPQPAPSLAGETATSAESGAPATPSDVEVPGALLPELSDDFEASTLSARWSWIRPPAQNTFAIADGSFRFNTQAGDIYQGFHTASVLSEPVPTGDFIVEVKLSNDVPAVGQYNFAQGGLVVYKDDFNYVKLVSVAINETRQIEFAKQYVPIANPKYGSSLLASPADATYLRIVKRQAKGSLMELYSAYSSHDGMNWSRGGTWTHTLGSGARIGLVSMAHAGFTNFFDYVHVYSLQK